MPQRTCGTSGCPNAHRAKGLCSSCYNRQHQPDRHRKVAIPCGHCGTPTLKHVSGKYAERFCSFECRDAWRLASGINVCPAGNRTSCPVPWRTCPGCGVEWFRYGSQAIRCDACTVVAQLARADRQAVRVARLAELDRLMQPRPCDDCGSTYTPGTTVQRYCSARCLRRVMKRERKAREHGAQGSFTWTQVIALFLLFDRRCAYCAEAIDGQPDPDHVLPLSRGGHNGISNILPACRPCNADKRDVLIEDWNEDRERRGLPMRITSWDALDPRYLHLAPALAHAG
jgi:hypothetical protein